MKIRYVSLAISVSVALMLGSERIALADSIPRADSIPKSVLAPLESTESDRTAPARITDLRVRDEPRRRITLRPDLETGLWLALFAMIGGLASAALQGCTGYLFRRQTAHYDGLVRLQFSLTIAADRLAANTGRIAKVRDELQSGVLVFVFPVPFRIDEACQHELYNQTLLNEALLVSAHLIRFNDALAGVRSGYESLRDNFIQHQDDLKVKNNYEFHVGRMDEGFRQLEASLPLLKAKIELTLARVRVHLRQEQALAKRLRRTFLRSNDPEAGAVKEEWVQMTTEAAKKNEELKRDLTEAVAPPAPPSASST